MLPCSNHINFCSIKEVLCKLCKFFEKSHEKSHEYNHVLAPIVWKDWGQKFLLVFVLGVPEGLINRGSFWFSIFTLSSVQCSVLLDLRGRWKSVRSCDFLRVRYPFFFQAEDGIRDVERSRGLGDVYKRQVPEGLINRGSFWFSIFTPSSVQCTVDANFASRVSKAYLKATCASLYAKGGLWLRFLWIMA